MKAPHSFPSRAATLSTLAAGLLALAASPAFAVPSVNVTLAADPFIPNYNNQFIFEVMAGDSQNEPATGRLALDLVLKNNEASPVTIDRVELNFTSPVWQEVLATSLRMSCPYPWIQGTTTVQLGTSPLVMGPGQTCRLGLVDDPVFSLPASASLGIEVFFAGVTNPLMIAERNLVAYFNSTPLGSYRFPASNLDLNPGEFWSGRNATAASGAHRFNGDPTELYAYDMGVVRFDSIANAWVDYTTAPGASAKDSDDDYLVFGKPVYAMAGGRVVGCVRTNTDDSGSTNFIDITDGTERVHYSHFRFNTIPPRICADGAVVEEGEKLGEVGSPGVSVPHLHVDVTRDLDPVPLNFNDALVVDREDVTVFPSPPNGNAPWSELDKVGLSFTRTAIWPAPLRRRGEAVDTGITTTSLAYNSITRTTTASRTAAGNLRVSLWNTDSTGEAVLLSSQTGSAISKVSVASPLLTTDAAVAMITAAGNLKISAYDQVGTSLSNTANYNGNPALDVVAVQGNFNRGIVTGVRTQGGTLKVIAWNIDAGAGTITRLGEDVAGTINEVALAGTSTFPGVVVAVRTGADRLKLITYKVTASGATVTRISDVDDALAQQIAIARIGPRLNGEDLVVTAIRTLAGDLELVSWSISASGAITRLDDLQAGAITEVSLARATNKHLLVSVGTGAGDLKTIAFHVDDNGAFRRRGELVGGAAGAIRQGSVKANSNANLAVTALADGASNLKLIVHQVLLTD